MKKEWQKPVLEMLDVKMTMHSVNGTVYDANWAENTPPVIDPATGDHMDMKS